MDEKEKAEIEDLRKRAEAWAESERGQERIAYAIRTARETSEELDRMRRVTPETLTKILR